VEGAGPLTMIRRHPVLVVGGGRGRGGGGGGGLRR
jgi:hypothetical protein